MFYIFIPGIIAIIISPLVGGGRKAVKMDGAIVNYHIDHPAYKSNEIIIGIKPNRSMTKSSFLRRGHSIAREMTYGNSTILTVKINDGESMEDAIKTYSSQSQVEFAQPNYIYTLASNDPGFSSQWYLKNTGQYLENVWYNRNNPGVAGCDIDIENAWKIVKDCSKVIVAVVDTGVNYMHEDLKDNMWDGTKAGYPKHGYDFVFDTDDPMDYHGHGTHVAGIIASEVNNGIGVAGICPRVKIMALQVFDRDGYAYSDTIANAILFAINNGAHIINMSLGTASYDPLFARVVSIARESGVLVVVAAGNYSTNLDFSSFYPCEFKDDNIICVAALDQSYNIAWFSNYGKNSVDIAAPGVNILSTCFGNYIAYIEDDTIEGWKQEEGSLNPWGTNFLDQSFMALTHPSDFSYSKIHKAYIPSISVYKTFDLSRCSNPYLYFEAFISLYDENDKVTVYYSTDENPLASGNKIKILELCGSYSDSIDRQYYPFMIPLNGCAGKKCTVIFERFSNIVSSHNRVGVAIRNIKILHPDSSFTGEYAYMSGTSMAAPIVAGVAAMFMSLNPSYSYRDIIKVIMDSSESRSNLKDKVISGKAIDANSVIRFISAPKNLRVRQ